MFDQVRPRRSGRVWLLGVALLSVVLSGCFGTPEDTDGLESDVEREGYTVTVRTLDGQTHSYHVTSSPYDGDEDHDGLDDQQERLERTDPRSPDTDGDGLLDGDNITLDKDDARAAKWVEAGIAHRTDGDEIEFFGERGGPRQRTGGDPRDADTDRDGLSDGFELAGFDVHLPAGTRTVSTRAHAPDTDSDGLIDGLEFELGLDPTDADSDGDGVPDRSDVDGRRDVSLALDVGSIVLSTVPGGGTTTDVYVVVQATGGGHTSAAHTLVRDEPDDGAAFSATAIPIDDGGGDVMLGRHNLTVTVTFLSWDGRETRLVDLFSGTTGGESLFPRVDARNGALSWAPGGRGASGTPWPGDATFEGAHGSVTLTLAPV